MHADDAARASGETGLRDPDGLVGRTVAGKYEVHDVLAKGGMGRIYRATQVPLGRPVALKVLHDDLDEGADSGFQKRFLLEAASCAQLRHPNIIVVYDYGKLTETDRGAYFMAMELVEGPTLGQVLHEGVVPAARALRITREIARALREAHRQGMVHRDLKPSNVMIASSSEGEQIKVLDFGLVKVMRDDSEELTKEGHFLGSPKYMAPEQIKRAPVDGRADLYALGVLLYHMLAGHVPFEGDQAVQTLMAHLNDPVPPLPHRPDVTPAIEQIVLRCLEKEPEHRFASADALIRAIDECAPSVSGWSGEMAAIPSSGEGPTISGESSITRTNPIPRAALMASSAGSSSSAATSPASVAAQPVAPPARRLPVAILVIAGSALAAVVAALALPGGSPPAEPTVALPAAPAAVPPPLPAVAAPSVHAPAPELPARFTLFVASTPTGATVSRDGVAIGRTPTFVELDPATLEGAPARFELTLEGHASHVFTQGVSREDVHVTAELQAVAAADPERTVRRRPRIPATSTDTPPPTGEDTAIKTRR